MQECLHRSYYRSCCNDVARPHHEFVAACDLYAQVEPVRWRAACATGAGSWRGEHRRHSRRPGRAPCRRGPFPLTLAATPDRYPERWQVALLDSLDWYETAPIEFRRPSPQAARTELLLAKLIDGAFEHPVRPAAAGRPVTRRSGRSAACRGRSVGRGGRDSHHWSIGPWLGTRTDVRLRRGSSSWSARLRELVPGRDRGRALPLRRLRRHADRRGPEPEPLAPLSPLRLCPPGGLAGRPAPARGDSELRPLLGRRRARCRPAAGARGSPATTRPRRAIGARALSPNRVTA